MLRISALLGLALTVSFAAGDAGARCLRYEPATVTLTGLLSERVVPGPPGYRNIARGDIPETVLFLELDEPVCVKGDPMLLRNASTVAAIDEFQVRVTGHLQRSLIGKRVKATGSLFASHSLAHRTRVVITTVGIREHDD